MDKTQQVSSEVRSNVDMNRVLELMFNNVKKSDLEINLEQTRREMSDSAKEASLIKDSYGNSLLSIGNNDKVERFTNNQFTNNSLNYLLWLSLYNDSWVFRRAIDKPAQDEIRCGINLQLQDEKKNLILKDLKKSRTSLIQLLQWGGLFGGAIAVMIFDNIEDDEYAHPVNWEKVRASKSFKLYVTDRWYGCKPYYDDLVVDMSNLDYGKPKFYDIIFADGKSIKVHHDYVLRYEHRGAPPLIKNGQLQGWGYAEGSHILNELMKDDKLRASIQSLVDKCLIEVIKMTGMRGLFMGQDSANSEQIEKRLEMVNWGRNFNSLTFLDKDDDYQMNGFSGLTGLSELLEQNMWCISAALEMQGVLYGDLKQGFSNDVDAMERYDEVINGRNEMYVRPVYEKFLWMLYNKYGINEKVEFEFNSLLVKKQNKEKMESLKYFIDICSQLLTDGVIDSQQYAKAVMSYSSREVVDFDFTDEKIEQLADKTAQELEEIEL